ncbi:MAG TPA: DUF3309 family protein [Sphingomicrobium sp.]|nr:DUF3309 family protein [Sphingomicrobium sp.]
MLFFWLFVILTILLVALLPVWPYARSRNWGYVPSALALALLLILLVVFALGVIAVPWPWYAAH